MKKSFNINQKYKRQRNSRCSQQISRLKQDMTQWVKEEENRISKEDLHVIAGIVSQKEKLGRFSELLKVRNGRDLIDVAIVEQTRVLNSIANQTLPDVVTKVTKMQSKCKSELVKLKLQKIQAEGEYNRLSGLRGKIYQVCNRRSNAEMEEMRADVKNAIESTYAQIQENQKKSKHELEQYHRLFQLAVRDCNRDQLMKDIIAKIWAYILKIQTPIPEAQRIKHEAVTAWYHQIKAKLPNKVSPLKFENEEVPVFKLF